MQPEEVQALLEAGLANCEVRVQGEGSHFDVLVIGDLFEGLRPVKRQQQVYAVLNERIADGSIHAINIRSFTPGEWAAQG